MGYFFSPLGFPFLFCLTSSKKGTVCLFQLQQNWGAPGKLCPFLQSAGPKGETEETGGGQPQQVCQSLRSRGENKWEKEKLIKTPTSPWQKARGPRQGFLVLLFTEVQEPCLLRFYLSSNQRLEQQVNWCREDISLD